LEACRSVISLANREGIEAEVFLLKRDLKSIRITSNEIVEAQNIVEGGAGIRVARNSSMGFSATNTLERNSVETAYRSALRIAKSSARIPNWGGLPTPLPTSRESVSLDSYDKELALKSPDEIAELSLEMLKQVTGHSSSSSALTSVLIAVFEEFSIFNSNGLEHLAEPSTVLYSRIIVEAKKAAECCTAMKQFCSRRLADFNPESAIEEAIRSATQVLHLPRRRISKSKCDVILSPQSAGAFTAYLVAPMIVGKSVQTGASCFTNMSNTRVAVESFSLKDQGRIKGGIGSAIVDDEGNPTRTTTIIKNGLLKGFLYDILTACRSEESSTGNARRASDTLGRTYLRAPEPLPTNLVIESGDYGSEELIEETKEAVLLDSIDYTFPLVPERGYFSVTSSLPALLIEKGEIEGYTQNLTISDELSKALTRVSGIGKDIQQSTYLGSTVTFSPYLRIRDMAISYGS